MRPMLDKLYALSGALAALFLLAIGILVIGQVAGRLFGFMIPSADDFARLSMGASSFLALAYTMRRGAHIRVNLLIDRLPPGPARAAEIFCLLCGVLLLGFFSYYCIDSVRDGILFPDYTIGLIPIPKWIPQVGMAIGVILLFVSFVDDLVCTLRGGTPSYNLRTGGASADPADRHAAHE
jgi:TRAP-type C4-dicarboxylate transport system permease small subunit